MIMTIMATNTAMAIIMAITITRPRISGVRSPSASSSMAAMSSWRRVGA
jgi:hypothetical protein